MNICAHYSDFIAHCPNNKRRTFIFIFVCTLEYRWKYAEKYGVRTCLGVILCAVIYIQSFIHTHTSRLVQFINHTGVTCPFGLSDFLQHPKTYVLTNTRLSHTTFLHTQSFIADIQLSIYFLSRFSFSIHSIRIGYCKF